MFDSDEKKDSRGQEQNTNAEHKDNKDWVKESAEEAKREKKKAFGFNKSIKKGIDLRKKAMFGGKFTHGTRGKPTHGPRGNQG